MKLKKITHFLLSSFCVGILFFSFFSFMHRAYALTLEKGEKRYGLAKTLSYLIDSKHQLQEKEIATGKYDDQFTLAGQNTLNLGFRSDTIWLRFEVSNPFPETKEIYVEYNFPLIEDLRLFYLDENEQFNFYKTGILFPFETRPLKNKDFIFPAKLPPESKTTFYMRVQSRLPLEIPLAVSTPKAFLRYIDQFHLIIGGYLGIIAVMILYNLFLYFSVRDKAYLFYLSFLASSVGVEISLSGLAYQLWPNSITWNQSFLFFSVAVTCFTLLQFGRTFLKTEMYLKTFDKITQIYILIGIAILIAMGVWTTWLFLPVVLYATFTVLLQLAMGIWSLKRGYNPARYFLASAIMFAAGGFLTAFLGLGLIPTTDFTRTIYIIGSSLEAIFLSLALGDRINLLRKEHIASIKLATQAQAQAHAKSEFLAKMSHEIRTPMNGVLGMVELLKYTQLNFQQKSYIDTIQNSGKTLLNVINDILDYSKIESGKIELEKISFNLETLANDCMAMFASAARDKNIDFVVFLDPKAPIQLEGDPTRLRQVLFNLLSNAFKFTHQGHVALKIENIETKSGECHLRFSVEDTGIGISPGDQKKLFKSFVQADSSITREYGGTGLGLAISKQLVNLMNGKIYLKSQINEGSEFFFELHFQSKTLKATHLQNLSGRLHSYRLLIIEPKAIFRNFIETHASHWGMQVHSASSSFEALSQISASHKQRKPFDLIFIEKFLPDMSGLQLLKRIQKDISQEKTHIVMACQQNDSLDKNALQLLGLESILEKPFNHHELFRTFWKELKGENFEEAERFNHNFQPLKQYQLKSLVVEDNRTNQMVILSFLRKMGVEAELAQNGIEAIEIYKNRNFDIVFMDCQMPKMDGYVATKKIRKYEAEQKIRRTPIVALTAHAMEEHRHKSLEAGMDDHLTKPIEIQALEESIEKWVLKENRFQKKGDPKMQS